MKKKNLGGRPPVDPYHRATKTLNFTPSQLDEMEKLGFSRHQTGQILRKYLDEFITANGGSAYERK